jgi:hypothetical protein
MKRSFIRPPALCSAIVVGAGLAAILGACGGGGTITAKSTSSTTVAASGAARTPGGGSFPGASGSVADISGSSMEVQNQQSGQVTVSWTSSTAFTQTATVTASAVTAGECVTVTGSDSNGTITARSVTVSQPTSSGSCASAFPGGGQGFPGSRPPGTFPSSGSGGPPGSVPSGFNGAGISFASGKVTSTTADTLALYGFSSAGFTPGSQSSTPPTSVADTSLTVDLGSSTTYTETRTAAAANLAVGDCVTASGTTDSTGAVAASTVRITSTGGQTCTTGFGGFGGGSPNG